MTNYAFFIVIYSSDFATWVFRTESISLLLSIIAIVITFLRLKSNEKTNQNSLNSIYHKEIFFDFLVREIPEAQRLITYNNKMLENTEYLCEILNDMRRTSIFYKYNDKNFYNDLSYKIHELDDMIVSKSGELSHDEFSDFNTQLQKGIEEIYTITMDKYIGKG